VFSQIQGGGALWLTTSGMLSWAGRRRASHRAASSSHSESVTGQESAPILLSAACCQPRVVVIPASHSLTARTGYPRGLAILHVPTVSAVPAPRLNHVLRGLTARPKSRPGPHGKACSRHLANHLEEKAGGPRLADRPYSRLCFGGDTESIAVAGVCTAAVPCPVPKMRVRSPTSNHERTAVSIGPSEGMSKETCQPPSSRYDLFSCLRGQFQPTQKANSV